VFEFGRAAPSSVCSAQAKHPLANDFLSGVLAVVIASPCTAPFMGVSLGFAIGLPAAQALLLFAALGSGWRCPTWSPASCPPSRGCCRAPARG
jgi:thiol:disulfide interchange protein